jgi:hypothetical protein
MMGIDKEYGVLRNPDGSLDAKYVERLVAESVSLQTENAALKLDMGTVKQAREMTERAMATARAWRGRANETREECAAALLRVEHHVAALKAANDG